MDAVYRERLSVPLRWWLVTAALLASVWVAYAVATPPLVAAAVAAVLALVVVGMLVAYGRALLEVAPSGFRAGRALLAWEACGDVAALTEAEFVHQRGPGADARAYLLLRPYLRSGVRVEVRDDADPTPYWLVSSRHPDRLAAALTAARRELR